MGITDGNAVGNYVDPRGDYGIKGSQYSNWLNPFALDHLGLFSQGGPLGAADQSYKDAARAGLTGVGQNASAFGNQAQGNYANQTAGINQTIQALRDQAAGKNSVSAMQLQQGLQQNQAQQQSMAAGASPNNAAMAARNAAMNMNNASTGLMGQQALAGLQERNNAQQQLGGLQLGARGQDVNAALGAGNTAVGAYGAQLNGPANQNWLQQNGQALAGMGAMVGAMSDRRLKKDVSDADESTRSIMDGLKAYKFRYKDEKYGKGEQVGIMAQDLEDAGLGHAVVNTREGKAVHGAKLATSNTAMLAALHKRVKALEE